MALSQCAYYCPADGRTQFFEKVYFPPLITFSSFKFRKNLGVKYTEYAKYLAFNRILPAISK